MENAEVEFCSDSLATEKQKRKNSPMKVIRMTMNQYLVPFSAVLACYKCYAKQ